MVQSSTSQTMTENSAQVKVTASCIPDPVKILVNCLSQGT